MGFRILRDPEAFSNAPARGPKRPKQANDAHLRWLRTLPCCITGMRPVEAAHVRYADPVYGKRLTGTAEKPDDKWAVPLSQKKHREQHDGNERQFWARHGLDPLRIALSLYACTGDDEQAVVILREAWRVNSVFKPALSERFTRDEID